MTTNSEAGLSVDPTFAEVLEPWSRGNEAMVHFISDLLPLHLRVSTSFALGESLGVLEKTVDISNFNVEQRICFHSFIAECCKWSRSGFVGSQEFDSSVTQSPTIKPGVEIQLDVA
jgi:hypothetical protein